MTRRPVPNTARTGRRRLPWRAWLLALLPAVLVLAGLALAGGLTWTPVVGVVSGLALAAALVAGGLYDRLQAQAIERAVAQRVGDLRGSARQSEALNASVLRIRQAVGSIAAARDLTIRVPSGDDLTGPIADAVNQLTEETRRLLWSVRGVSQDVARATVAVRSQSESAASAAARERHEVGFAARELATAARTLEAIAEGARTCDDAAGRAVQAAGEAMQTVEGTVQGIARSRALIRETEKRIKRLGERSQEVGQVVGIVRDISERTGILALNASMQAASAGEAGRTFAVLADEVKRLSESARSASVEIADLVGAIQSETGETVLAMNQAIARIVEVSRLAEDAGDGMLRTRQETDALAAAVRDIARSSAEQARAGAALIERARIIEEASNETARQLSRQTAEIQRLFESAKGLMREVGTFRVGER